MGYRSLQNTDKDDGGICSKLLGITQIITINWDKIHKLSQSLVIMLTNVITQVPGLAANHHTLGLEISSRGISLTGSISTGFAIGFMKG